MAKEISTFRNATFWLNQICILPYTEEELDGIGCLGFDMKQNKEFAQKYMEKLLEKRHLISENKHISFSELNLQIYGEILQQPDMNLIPNWISETMLNSPKEINNTIKSRIIKMYNNIKNNTGPFSNSDSNTR